MNQKLLTAAVFMGALALSGCDRLGAAWTGFQAPKASAVAVPSAPPPPVATPVVAPLTATGHGLSVKALPDEALQSEAGVFEVHRLTKQEGGGVKLYATAGGDPAMNGLHTYIAFYRSPAEGWWVYGLGDFLNFKILNEVPGRVDLEIEENTMDQATGTVGSRKRHAIVVFPVGPVNEEQPVNVRMIPAA